MRSTAESGEARRRHWDEVYERLAPSEVSWYQREPRISLELIDEIGTPESAAIVDIGGGTSTLAAQLLTRGFGDLTVIDVSPIAVSEARSRVPATHGRVDWLVADVLGWVPARRFDVWHDRAVFHFLVDERDRARYRTTLDQALQPGGHVIVGTFADDGPESCSGLPTERYDLPSLASAFGDGFELVAHRREQHVTPTGRIQPFTWVVLRRRAD